MELLRAGTQIYYGGDMANDEGTGTIKKVTSGKWGTNYAINMDDGREMNIPAQYFSAEYLGHGGTRFVTLAAYDKYRSNCLEKIKNRVKVKKGKVITKECECCGHHEMGIIDEAGEYTPLKSGMNLEIKVDVV